MKQLNTGGPDGDFKFVSKGNLAYLGDWTAIYDRSKAESGPHTKATGCAVCFLLYLWDAESGSMQSSRMAYMAVRLLLDGNESS